MTRSEKAMKDAAEQLSHIKDNNTMSTIEKQDLAGKCGITLNNLREYLNGSIGKLQVALTIIEQYENVYGSISSKTPTQ